MASYITSMHLGLKAIALQRAVSSMTDGKYPMVSSCISMNRPLDILCVARSLLKVQILQMEVMMIYI